jgi:ketosteroid isomerase-like protein
VSHEQLVREAWGALSRGDYDAVEAAFAPEAKWRAVEDGPWNPPLRGAGCESRSQILRVMRDNRAAGKLRGEVEEVLDVGSDRAIVAFRPLEQEADNNSGDAWPLDNGIRYVVLTLDGDGLVSEMKGCRDRTAAFEYVGEV